LPSEAPSASPEIDLPTLLANVAGAEGDPADSELNLVWSAILSEVSHVGASGYVAPKEVTAYVGGTAPPSACAVGKPASYWAENAFYCRTDRSIWYDIAWFEDVAGVAGRYAPAAIMAHEWGHHIENVLGIYGLSIRSELQADCFAGLFLANTQEILPGVTGSDDDLAQTLKELFDIGDKRYSASLWFLPGVHGSSQQRIRAFGTGYTASFKSPGLPSPLGRGLATCYGYRDFEPKDYADVSPYRLLLLPGRSETQKGGTLLIDQEARLGFPTSSILLKWLPGDSGAAIVQALAKEFPGITPEPQEIDLGPNVAPGTGIAHYFVQRDPSVPGGVRSGMLGVIQPAAGGGGLAILVSRPNDGISEPLDAAEQQVLAEEIATLYEVLARLCGPDDSGVIGDPNLKLSCLTDQQ
jgi:hypothetical protein